MENDYVDTLNSKGMVVATNGTVEAGEFVQWSIAVTNNGQSAVSVDFTNAPPVGESLISKSLPPGAVVDSVTGTASWTNPDVEPGAGNTVVYTYETQAGVDKPCESGYDNLYYLTSFGKLAANGDAIGTDHGSTSNTSVVCGTVPSPPVK